MTHDGIFGESVLAAGVAEGADYEHVARMYVEDAVARAFEMRITRIDMHGVEGCFKIRPDMCNGHGTAQGGILFTFADALFAGACNLSGDTAVAAHVGIHFIAPVQMGEMVEGIAVTRREWGRNGISDVTLTVEGRVVAEFRGTSRIIRSA